MTELWLVRHGQTDWNLEERIQGWIDQPLNAAGEEQALELAGRLNGNHFEAIYSSPMQRAWRTAGILAEHLGLTVQMDDRLKEINRGAWEGLTWTDVEQVYPKELAAIRQDPARVETPGGESIGQVAKRAIQVANEISHLYPSGRVMIVSHGITLATLVSSVKGIPLDRRIVGLVPDNAEPIVVTWPPELMVD